jgi:hypothetical protein
MVVHPAGGVVASLTYADDHSELRRWTRGMDGLGELVAPALPSQGTDWYLFDVSVAADGTIWALEIRRWSDSQERLPARLMRTDGNDWQEVPLADVGVEVEPLAIELAADGRLLVDLSCTGADPDRAPDQRLPISAYGDCRWLAELGTDGRWVTTPIETDADVPWRWMVAATSDGAWFPLGGGDARCGGMARLSEEGVERYLADTCIHGSAVTPDERVWVTASRQRGYGDIREPQIYVIDPP